MFEQAASTGQRNVIGDWVLRIGIAVVFAIFGAEKFSSDPGGHWGSLFDQIGAGLVLLACSMLSAALILIFVIGHPADSIFSSLLFVALVAFGYSRRRRNGV